MKTWWELYERNKLKIEKCLKVGMEDKVENRQRVKKEVWEQHMKDPIAAVHQALRKVEADVSICTISGFFLCRQMYWTSVFGDNAGQRVSIYFCL